jgi:hypothetical protein
LETIPRVGFIIINNILLSPSLSSGSALCKYGAQEDGAAVLTQWLTLVMLTLVVATYPTHNMEIVQIFVFSIRIAGILGPITAKFMENLSHHLWYNSVTETWRNDLFYRSQFIS